MEESANNKFQRKIRILKVNESESEVNEGETSEVFLVNLSFSGFS